MGGILVNCRKTGKLCLWGQGVLYLDRYGDHIGDEESYTKGIFRRGGALPPVNQYDTPVACSSTFQEAFYSEKSEYGEDGLKSCLCASILSVPLRYQYTHWATALPK